MDFEARGRLIGAMRAESQRMFEVVERAGWRTPTACDAWEARDTVGPLVDTTHECLGGFDVARKGRR